MVMWGIEAGNVPEGKDRQEGRDGDRVGVEGVGADSPSLPYPVVNPIELTFDFLCALPEDCMICWDLPGDSQSQKVALKSGCPGGASVATDVCSGSSGAGTGLN